MISIWMEISIWFQYQWISQWFNVIIYGIVLDYMDKLAILCRKLGKTIVKTIPSHHQQVACLPLPTGWLRPIQSPEMNQSSTSDLEVFRAYPAACRSCSIVLGSLTPLPLLTDVSAIGLGAFIEEWPAGSPKVSWRISGWDNWGSEIHGISLAMKVLIGRFDPQNPHSTTKVGGFVVALQLVPWPLCVVSTWPLFSWHVVST